MYPFPTLDNSLKIFLKASPCLAEDNPSTFSARNHCGLNFSITLIPYLYNLPKYPSVPLFLPTPLKSLQGNPNVKASIGGRSSRFRSSTFPSITLCGLSGVIFILNV